MRKSRQKFDAAFKAKIALNSLRRQPQRPNFLKDTPKILFWRKAWSWVKPF